MAAVPVSRLVSSGRFGKSLLNSKTLNEITRSKNSRYVRFFR